MAGNNSIQFVRGTSSKRASHTETSLAGQPIYETDTNRLYVGDGETSVNDLTAVEASAADIAENVKDQNNGAGIKIWIGTQAEFEDLEADEDTIYYITDIVSVLEVDEALKTLKEQLASGAFVVKKATAADEATHSTTADSADNATKATQDASGNVITSTYATKNELSSGLSGKANTSGSYPNLTVGKATNADNATNATHAGSADEATTIGKYLHDVEFLSGELEGSHILRFQVISNDSTAYKKVSEVAQVLLDKYDGETMATGYAETLNAPIKFGFAFYVRARGVDNRLEVLYYFADGTSRSINITPTDTVLDTVVAL